MKDVWEESSRQAQTMIDTLGENFPMTNPENKHDNPRDSEETGETIEGLRLIAINVIGYVGYNTRRAWVKRVTPPVENKLTFMEATLAIVNNIILAVALPDLILRSRLMPAVIRTLGEAKTVFPNYARSFVAKERVFASHQPTLMGALVKKMKGASHAKNPDNQNKTIDPSDKPVPTASYLSEDEVIGNLFNFTIAGFDTTASTMAYAIMALALEPEWQDWIIEEIDQVVQRDGQVEYETCFPRMTRCLALMVRLHHADYLFKEIVAAQNEQWCCIAADTCLVRDAPSPHAYSAHHSLHPNLTKSGRHSNTS